MSRLTACVFPALLGATLIAGAAAAQVSTPGWEESGQATWYGARHQGRRTSSGDVFDQNQMTAASATVPLGTHVRVTMQETGATVVVRINDRHSPSETRVIDLSRDAAARIGLVARGKAMVTLTAAHADEVEVAEALDNTVDFTDASPRPRGLQRRHRAARVVVAVRPCCLAPSAVLIRH